MPTTTTNIQKFLDGAGVSTLWTRVTEEVAKVDKKAVDNAAAIAEHASKIAALEAGTYDDTELRGLIGDNTAAIATLNGDAETAGSVANTATAIAAAKVAEIVAGADASYDTLKEIADWIINDTTGAADMANDIATLQSLVGDKAVATQIAEAISAADLDKYALATDLNSLADRVKTLEDASYQNAEQVGSAIDDKIAALNLVNTYDAKGAAATAESNAKAYVDTEFAKIQALTEAEIDAAIASAIGN